MRMFVNSHIHFCLIEKMKIPQKIKDFTDITFASSLVNIDSIQNVTLNISPFQNKLGEVTHEKCQQVKFAQ